MAAKIFIDGEAGTTGLHIRERLAGRADIELIAIDPLLRKDSRARAEAINGADAVILCLPDEAAREAVAFIENESVRIIDASSAHRTARDWTYGFAVSARLPKQAQEAFDDVLRHDPHHPGSAGNTLCHLPLQRPGARPSPHS